MALAGAGCASYDVAPPGSDGCTFLPRSDATIIAEYTVSGGLAGLSSVLLAHDDGTIEEQAWGDGEPVVSERGAGAAGGLRDALDASGVFEVEQGCYRAQETVPDGSTTDLFLRDRSGSLFTFSRADGADVPEELEEAITVVRDYFAAR